MAERGRPQSSIIPLRSPSVGDRIPHRISKLLASSIEEPAGSAAMPHVTGSRPCRMSRAPSSRPASRRASASRARRRARWSTPAASLRDRSATRLREWLRLDKADILRRLQGRHRAHGLLLSRAGFQGRAISVRAGNAPRRGGGRSSRRFPSRSRPADRPIRPGLAFARRFRGRMTETVRRGGTFSAVRRSRAFLLPHPSWRNNGWLQKNPWFEAELCRASGRNSCAPVSGQAFLTERAFKITYMKK